jgi:hypothetical protein
MNKRSFKNNEVIILCQGKNAGNGKITLSSDARAVFTLSGKWILPQSVWFA